MATQYQVGDWVKCPGQGKVKWVYGWVATVENNRLYVDKGYLSAQWFNPEELSPAFVAQTEAEVEAIRDALSKVVKAG